MYSMDSPWKTFSNFKYARYATDVTFHQTNRPTGNMQEGKEYYSGKHKLYGYKTEVSVLPNGQAIGCTKPYPGSVSDIDIFFANEDFHFASLSKQGDEAEMADTGILVDDYADTWAVIMDKG